MHMRAWFFCALVLSHMNIFINSVCYDFFFSSSYWRVFMCNSKANARHQERTWCAVNTHRKHSWSSRINIFFFLLRHSAQRLTAADREKKRRRKKKRSCGRSENIEIFFTSWSGLDEPSAFCPRSVSRAAAHVWTVFKFTTWLLIVLRFAWGMAGRANLTNEFFKDRARGRERLPTVVRPGSSFRVSWVVQVRTQIKQTQKWFKKSNSWIILSNFLFLFLVILLQTFHI